MRFENVQTVEKFRHLTLRSVTGWLAARASPPRFQRRSPPRLVQEALVRLTQGRTTLIVAHRFSTIRHAHRIVVLQKGRIVEQGTQAELLASDGQFYRLAKLQAVKNSGTG